MKNHYSFLRKSLMAIGISLLATKSIGQIITLNEDWDHVGVLQGDSKLIATDTDPSGNLVYVSNRINGSNTEIYLSCIHKNGNLVWEEFLFSSGNDYGVDLSIDQSGNIYVLGAKVNNGQYDYHLIKYTTSGSLVWATTHDGSGMDDVPSSLTTDSNGDIYVTGFERKSLTNLDMATIKVNHVNGSIVWNASFGSTSLMENGLDIVVTPSGKVIVCGGAMNTSMVTNFKMVSYNASSGVQLQSSTRDRRMIFDEPMQMEVAQDGRIYVLGSSEFQGNRNIEVFAYNGDLGFLWNRTIDYNGAEDMGGGLAISSDNKPVITGFCTRADNSTFIYTSKLNTQNGTTLWEDIRSAIEYDKAARGNAITNDANGNVYVVGEMERENELDFVMFSLNENGETRFQKYFDSGDPMANDIPQDVVVYDDIIYVTGRTELSGNKQVQTLKYRISERTITPVMQGNVESHVSGEIIIRFAEDAIIPSAINKVGLQFGDLQEFVQPNAIAEIQAIYPTITWSKARTHKIFKRMTMNDSLSLTRTGDYIETQPFWAILLINVSGEDEIEVCNALNENQVLFSTLKYAHTNGFMSVDADPLYPQQHSLMSTTYPEADINVEPAWNVEIGQPNVKVGVYDSGLKWDHEDMGGLFYGDCPTCKVKGGWDYQADDDLFYTDNNGDNDDFPGNINNGHGTKVAGIIGALRNNNLGISGIAGGNYPYANPIPGEGVQTDPLGAGESIGVSFYGFRAVSIGLTLTEIANALIEGSTETPTFGYGLHIMNNSWQRNTQYNSEVPIVGAQNLMRDCQREIFRNQTVNVCSRGNNGNENNYFPSFAEREYWVLNVGGSGLIGEKHLNSSYGGDVDLIAPHDQALVQTTHNLSVSDYGDFSGTSASAPHVAGVAGLMLSHINDQPSTPNNLTPDDVEFLIQRYANDRTPSAFGTNYSIGYDNYSGHGLLDAGAVMEKIDRSEYIIRHYTAEYLVDPIPIGESIEGTFTFGTFDIPYGSYYGEIFSHPFIIQNNLNPGDVILNYWPLNSKSNLLDQFVPNINPATEVTNEQGCYIFGMNNQFGDVRGLIVHLLFDPSGNPIDVWYPVAPGDIATVGYTLHIQSQFADLDEELDDVLNVGCFPNPTDNNVNLSFVMREAGNIDVKVLDINGKVVHDTKQLYFGLGEQSYEIESNGWTNGMYFIQLETQTGEKTVKFIKQ